MQLVENNEIEKLNLLIPENPFLNFAEESNFKLNLLLIPDPFYTLDYFIQFTYEIDMELINNYRLLYFLPFPHYIHISKLKFKKIKTKEEFNKYYICPNINDLMKNFVIVVLNFFVQNAILIIIIIVALI